MISNVRGVCVTEKTAILIVNYKSENVVFSDLYNHIRYLLLFQSENIRKIHIYVDFRPIENGVVLYDRNEFTKIYDFLNTIFISCRSFIEYKKVKFYIHFNNAQISYFGLETGNIFKDSLLIYIRRCKRHYCFNMSIIMSNQMQYYRIGNGDHMAYLCIGIPAFKNKERIVKFQRIKKTCLSTGRYHQYTFNYKEPFYHLNFDDSGIEMYREGKLF